MSVYRYRQFRQTLKATPFHGVFMPYEWGGLPQMLPFQWFAYAEMFREFSREIANVINDLSRHAHELAAWRDILAELDDKGRLNVAHDFVDPVATIALNLPYVIRSRFLFASAHLCHQANQTKLAASWKDDLALDTEIYFSDLDKCGAAWKKYSKLKVSLERIGAKDYQGSTADFRNTYNHRFSPRVVIGQSRIVTRHVNSKTGSVTYGFGGVGPLTLETTVKLLEQQCAHCYKAFENFQTLIKEHETAIITTLQS